MSYTILLTGPADAGKRNLAARITNELTRRKVNVRPIIAPNGKTGCSIKRDEIRLVISDGPQTPGLMPADRSPEDMFVEMHVIRNEPVRNFKPEESPEVVVHSRKDGLKTGLNKILHFLETHRLIPERQAASPYADLFSAVTGSTVQINRPSRP